MTALKLFTSAPQVTGSSSVAPLTDHRRSASNWPEAFAKQRGLIAQELRQPEADHDFWTQELVAIHDAQVEYDRKVADIDEDIKQLMQDRAEIIGQIADNLANQKANIVEFMRRDDPAGYLRW